MNRLRTGERLHDLLTNKSLIFLFVFVILFIITINRPMFGDEGLWNYIGRVWIEADRPPYIGSVENKTPGIFELYAISNLLIGPNFMFVRILGIFAVLLTMQCLYCIAMELHSKEAGVVAMYIYGLTMSWEIMDGIYPSVTESFMCMFTAGAFYFIVKAKNAQNFYLSFLLTGLFSGLAISFKQVGIFAIIPLMLFALFIPLKGRSFISKFSGLSLIAIGILVSTFALLIPLFLSGVGFWDYVDGAWLILINKGSGSQSVDTLYAFFRFWLNSRIVMFYPLIFLAVFNKKIIKSWSFLCLLGWLIFDIFGAVASGLYFEHQMRQFIPALAVISGILISETNSEYLAKYSQSSKSFAKVLLLIILLFLPYKSLIINGYFHGFPCDQRDVGLWINKNTGENDKVFVVSWAGAGQIMTYAERLSPGKHFNVTFITTDNDKSNLLKELSVKPPECLVVNKYVYPKIGGLPDSFMSNYELQYKQGAFSVYLLK